MACSGQIGPVPVSQAFWHQGDDPSSFIMNWVDEKDRTFADVTGALEGAAIMPRK